MRVIKQSNRFKKDFKKARGGKGFSEKAFVTVIDSIRKNCALPAKYKNHKLQGEFIRCMECHIQSDVLLIYMIDSKDAVVYLLRIGSHSDLF